MLKPGDRIELLEMPHDPCPIERGTLGTVREVVPLDRRLTQIWVDWDNTRSLSLCIPPDQVRVLPEDE